MRTEWTPEQVSATEPEIYGPYSLLMSLTSGRLVIHRQDRDHKRTVAFVETLQQWDKFVSALKNGDSEVMAVHSIDR